MALVTRESRAKGSDNLKPRRMVSLSRVGLYVPNYNVRQLFGSGVLRDAHQQGIVHGSVDLSGVFECPAQSKQCVVRPCDQAIPDTVDVSKAIALHSLIISKTNFQQFVAGELLRFGGESQRREYDWENSQNTHRASLPPAHSILKELV